MQKLDQFLNLKEIMSLTGYRRSSIYELMKKRKFPQTIKIGDRAVRWSADEINSWMEKKKEARDKPITEHLTELNSQ